MENRQNKRPGQPSKRPVTKSRRTAPSAAPAGRPDRGSSPEAPRKRVRTTRPGESSKDQQTEREIVYTPAKPFNRKRLLLQIGVVVAVVVAIFFSLSLFFKVETVVVGGNERYSAHTIMAASGIKEGESLLGVNSARVSSLIITELPYVKLVRVGIKLPGTVHIEIEELDVVYAVQDVTGQWWLMTSDGRMVEMTDATGASERTKVLGVTLTDVQVGQQAVAQEAAPPVASVPGETTPVTMPITISSADRLDVALVILQYLEQNDVMGQMVSVDVTDMGAIQMWYGNRFRIVLGDSSDLYHKISVAMAAVGQLRERDRGTLDVSFQDLPEAVYTPQAD